MERWSGKVAVVTGASSGIGVSTVKALLKNGLIVVGLARRVEKMQAELGALPEAKGRFHAVKCDVSDDNDVAKAFAWIKKNVGKVQVLVNNAGVLKMGKFTETDNESIRNTLSVNVLGTVYCTKEALNVMQANKLEGHIINVNSVAGHSLGTVPANMHSNIYPATKYAITGLCESLVRELMGENIRVTSVSPGLVKTEMTDGLAGDLAALEASDIASAIIYVLGTPQRVQVKEITIPPLGGF